MQTRTRRPDRAALQGEGGGRRRLAHSAGATGHQDAPRGERALEGRRGGKARGHQAASSFRGEEADLVEPQRFAEEEGQRDEGGVQGASEAVPVEAGELSPPDLAPGGPQRRGERHATLDVALRPLCREAEHLGLVLVGEAALVAGVQDDRRRLHLQLLLREAVELHRLHDRHLLGDGHHDEGGAAGVAEESEQPARVVADGSRGDRGRRDERDLQEGEAVAGGGGVHDEEVPERLLGEAGPRLLQHHDLAEDHQLLEAGSGREEAAVDRALEDPPGEDLELHDVPDVLVHDRRRVEVHGEQAGEDLGLAAP